MGEAEDQADEKPAKRNLKKPKIIFAATGGAVIIILAVAILIIGLANHHAAKHASKKQSYGYTLTPPKGWGRVNPPPQGSSVAFSAPVTDVDSTGQLKAFIAVQTLPLSSQGQKLTFPQVANAYFQQLAQNYQNYKQLGAASTAIEGQPAQLVTFTYTQDKASVTSDTLVTVNHEVLYDVSGESLTSAWQSNSQQIEKSLQSFRP